MAGDSQDPGLRDEKIGRHDEMKGSWVEEKKRSRRARKGTVRCHSFL